jgi:hypothetical protein
VRSYRNTLPMESRKIAKGRGVPCHTSSTIVQPPGRSPGQHGRPPARGSAMPRSATLVGQAFDHQGSSTGRRAG